MRLDYRIKIAAGIAFYIAILAMMVAAESAWASGDCRNGSCNGGDAIVTTGDNTAENTSSIGGSRAYGLSFSMGDVAIEDCRESTQGSIVMVWSWQNVRLNPWCAAEVYDAKGLHEVAALIRCDIKEIRDLFESQDECLKKNTVSFEVPRGTPETSHEEVDLSPILSSLSELESRYSELQKEYDALTASQARSRANAARVAQADRDDAQRLLEALRDDEQD